MTARLLWLACFLLSAWPADAPAVATQEPPPLSEARTNLERCIASLRQSAPPGQADEAFTLSDSCPTLAAALSSSPIDGLLGQPLGEQTSLSQLEDLRTLLDSYRAPISRTDRFDYEGLSALLSETLVETPPPQPTLWERFMAWLFEKLRRHQSEERSRLSDFLDWLEPLVPWITRGLMLLIMALALIIIANEVRHSTLSTWLQTRRVPRLIMPDPGFNSPAPPLTWEAIMAMPAAQQPVAMLGYVIHHLGQRGLLPNRLSLTNREMLERLERVDSERALHFETIVTSAEMVLYGDRPLDHAQHSGLVRAADALRA